MAARERVHPSLVPERHLARALLAELGQAPPVDVEAAIAKFADVQEVLFPTSHDAVMIRAGVERPRVLVRPSPASGRKRRRFTLAHELGHIVIPWQAGAFFCHADLVVAHAGTSNADMEGEAHAFASEFLVPTQWLQERLADQSVTAATVAEVTQAADVSIPVAAQAICGLEPGNIAIIATDASGVVTYAGKSPDCMYRLPEWEKPFTPIHKGAFRAHTSARVGSKTVAVYEFGPMAPVSAPEESRAELLEEILADCAGGLEQAKSLQNQISGIVGAFNSDYRGSWNLGAVTTGLGQRFAGRPRLAAVVAHRRFRAYLAATAQGLIERRAEKAEPKVPGRKKKIT